jgi:hypothetical protein
MITVLRAHGLHIAIYTDDHPPPHVHVLGAGTARILLVGQDGLPEVMQARGVKFGDMQRVLRTVTENQAMLLNLWRQIHG